MENENPLPLSVKFLILSNKLIVKAFESKSLKELHFVMLNETKHILSYDRAYLWDIKGKTPKIVGISGLVDVNENIDLIKAWESIFSHIPNRNIFCPLEDALFSDCQEEWNLIKGKGKARYFWLPIYSKKDLFTGLMVSFSEQNYNKDSVSEEMDIFMNFLMPGYAAALEKFQKKKFQIGGRNYRFALFGGLFLLFLMGNFFKVPLRIVSTCEVVSKDPIVIAAPLEGVIKDIKVMPGQSVKQGDLLVEYEKNAFLQDLHIAQKEVELREAEIGRVNILGYDDQDKLSELKILTAKNDQAHAKLDFARYQFDLLTIESPADGIVSVDNPEESKGRPVSMGEKILIIDNPDDTKILIWIAEGDNVSLDKKDPIKIILNANPGVTYFANLDYISTISKVNNENIVSFEAEASWKDQPKDIKIGQKGLAIIYGDDVSLVYYLFRKPILFFRKTFGF